LFDTGAAVTLINSKLFKRLQEADPTIVLSPYSGPNIISCNSSVHIAGQTALRRVQLTDEQQDELTDVTVLVADMNIQPECILGSDIYNKINSFARTTANLKTEIERYSRNLTAGFNSFQRHAHTGQSRSSEAISGGGSGRTLPIWNRAIPAERIDSLKTAEEILREHLEKCSANDLVDLTPDKNHTMAFQIKLREEKQKPIACKRRLIPQHLKAKVQQRLEELEAAKIIAKRYSDWAAPMRVVHNSDDSIRITIDYTALNGAITDDNYPLPSIQELYNVLSKADTFSKIDLKSAYHQIPVHPESIAITGFICEFGTYVYLAMPMGIKTAPAHFQRCIELIFADLIARNVLRIYIDDLLLFTDGIAAHLEYGIQVAERLAANNLKCSSSKLELAKQELNILGHTISAGQIKPDAARAAVVVEYKLPKTLTELQAWLGFCNYFRRFIPQYALLAQPLYELTICKNIPQSMRKKNGAPNGNKVNIQWTEETIQVFEELKIQLTSPLVLALPNFELPMTLTTDASNVGYGAVLEQEVDGECRPLAFYSKCYTPAQRNYSTIEKELLAIVMAVEHFHLMLYGRDFIIYTDHKPLSHLPNRRTVQPRLERWLMRLSIYKFKILHKSGKENIIADFLSRLAAPNDVNTNKDDDYFDIVVAPIRILEQFNVKSEQNEQLNDADLVWIMNLIRSHGDMKPIGVSCSNNIQRILLKEYDKLRIVDGFLLRETETEDGLKKSQLVIAKSNVNGIIRMAHSSVFGAHLGRVKTIERVLDRFYRPELIQQIKEFIRTCDTCQKVKAIIRTGADMMIIKPIRPNQLVTTDLAGPFIRSTKGNKYFMVMMDHFTKYLQIYPLRNITAESVAKKIVKSWCCIFGIPETILSDGGTQYQSKLIDLIYDYFDIKRLKTTPFHPAGNGLSERAVGTVKTMIKAFISDDQKNWDTYLNELSFAYNSAVHSSTKMTPFELMFGRRPKVPLDLFVPAQHDDLFDFSQLKLPSITKSYLINLKEKMQKSFQIAASNRDIRMSKAKTNHDRQIRKLEYKAGDLVLLDHPSIKIGQTGGLNHRFHGPYEVLKQCDNRVDYEIKSTNKKRNKIKIVHCNRLKIYHVDCDDAHNQLDVAEVSSIKDDELPQISELIDKLEPNRDLLLDSTDESEVTDDSEIVDESELTDDSELLSESGIMKDPKLVRNPTGKSKQKSNNNNTQKGKSAAKQTGGEETEIEIESSSDSSIQMNSRRSKRLVKRIDYNEKKKNYQK
jgi:hypothetical protein